MKANELRIGNYILNDSNKIVDVTSVSEFSVMHTEKKKAVSIKTGSQTEFCEPIPLTEEWLVKFGFEKDFDDWGLVITGFLLTYNFNDGTAINGKYMSEPIWLDCEHVHQLQNLYFALTNKEL